MRMTVNVPLSNLEKDLPSMNDAWVPQLLSIQKATKADVSVRPVVPDPYLPREEYPQPIKDFVAHLEKNLSKAKSSGDAIINILNMAEK